MGEKKSQHLGSVNVAFSEKSSKRRTRVQSVAQKTHGVFRSRVAAKFFLIRKRSRAENLVQCHSKHSCRFLIVFLTQLLIN